MNLRTTSMNIRMVQVSPCHRGNKTWNNEKNRLPLIVVIQSQYGIESIESNPFRRLALQQARSLYFEGIDEVWITKIEKLWQSNTMKSPSRWDAIYVHHFIPSQLPIEKVILKRKLAKKAKHPIKIPWYWNLFPVNKVGVTLNGIKWKFR